MCTTDQLCEMLYIEPSYTFYSITDDNQCLPSCNYQLVLHIVNNHLYCTNSKNCNDQIIISDMIYEYRRTNNDEYC